MSEWIDSVVQHSRRELELLGLHQVGLDDVVVEFIKDLHTKLGNQPGAMKSIANYVEQLIDKKPIAPITEADFDQDGRCTRYEYIYRAGDGRYYNDRAVVFKKGLDTQYMYQGQHMSKREITLPYILREEVVTRDVHCPDATL
jgi:hypothetical protein